MIGEFLVNLVLLSGVGYVIKRANAATERHRYVGQFAYGFFLSGYLGGGLFSFFQQNFRLTDQAYDHAVAGAFVGLILGNIVGYILVNGRENHDSEIVDAGDGVADDGAGVRPAARSDPSCD